MSISPEAQLRRQALIFVVLAGVVSLCSDFVYEGARSIVGPYLGLLGASAAVIGFVAGLGELMGYAVRLGSGYLADRTRRYWTLTIVGYVINLLAVPLLALVGQWLLAAVLLLVERLGKALRAPARDALLSHAAGRLGVGQAFALHEALDQIGAVLGPLVVGLVLLQKDHPSIADYQTCFAILGIPVVVVFALLALMRWLYPNPSSLEPPLQPLPAGKVTAPPFRLYLIAAGLLAAGFADFPLLAFHLNRSDIFTGAAIAWLYAWAMGVDALAALVLGPLFDRFGLVVLMAATVLSASAAPLVFLGNGWLALVGVTLWGVGMGAIESILRAAVAKLVPPDQRGRAYGWFSAIFGVAWFLGSALLGVLYDVSLPLVAGVALVLQLGAVAVLVLVRRS